MFRKTEVKGMAESRYCFAVLAVERPCDVGVKKKKKVPPRRLKKMKCCSMYLRKEKKKPLHVEVSQ